MTARENELADRCAYLADEKHTPLLDIEREELREAASTLRANAACTADPDKAIEHVRDDAARAARSNAT